jgi:aquaporin Z
MAMVYCAAPLTCGQYNPAVTFAIWLRGRLTLSNVIYFLIAQILGGIVGAGLSLYWLGADAFVANTPGHPGISEERAFLCELLYSMLIILAVLHTTTTEATKDNQFFGMAIGFAQLAGRLAVARISGGVFNPAVVSGLYAVSPEATAGSLWLYWIAPYVGAGVAVVVFVLMAPTEFSADIPRWILLFLQDFHISKYFTEFMMTMFLTLSAVLGNGGASCREYSHRVCARVCARSCSCFL